MFSPARGLGDRDVVNSRITFPVLFAQLYIKQRYTNYEIILKRAVKID